MVLAQTLLVPPSRRLFAFATLLLLALSMPAGAHPISLTEARVHIAGDEIVVELDVMPEDLVMYYWMRPDERFRFRRDALAQQAEVHTDFLLRYLHIRGSDGARLDGTIESIDLRDLPDEGVHFEDLMAHTIGFTIRYSHPGPVEFVTLSQTFDGDDPAIPAEMTATFFRDGVAIDRAFITHSGAHTAAADSPPIDDEQARERSFLGVTNYSAVYSYVYIRKSEVRHEMLIPLLTLNRFLPVIDRGAERMSVEQQREARDRIGAYFAANTRVHINAEPAGARVDRIDFFGPEIRDFHTSPPEQEVSLFNARVGVILSFPAATTPEEVEIEWLAFPDIPYLRSNIYAYDEERRSFAFNPIHREFVWEGAPPEQTARAAIGPGPAATPAQSSARAAAIFFIAVGAALTLLGLNAGKGGKAGPRAALLVGGPIAIACGGVLWLTTASPRPIDDEDARLVFNHLHTLMYDALANESDEAVYDALALGVSDQLLEDLFLGVVANLRMMSEAGGVRRIDRVEILETELLPAEGRPAPDRFACRSEWTVEGTLEHWGHIHTLKNRYSARFDIRRTDDGWRVTGFRPIDQQQVEVHSRLRR